MDPLERTMVLCLANEFTYMLLFLFWYRIITPFFSTSRLLFSRHGYGWSENKFDIENKWMKTHRQTSEGRKMKIKETVRAMRARNNPSVCKITKRKRLISVTNWIEDFFEHFSTTFSSSFNSMHLIYFNKKMTA